MSVHASRVKNMLIVPIYKMRKFYDTKRTEEGERMQVYSDNGSLQNRYFSGTGSIGGIHLPDFQDKYVFTKKKSGVSEQEYRRQIRKQAYEEKLHIGSVSGQEGDHRFRSEGCFGEQEKGT